MPARPKARPTRRARGSASSKKHLRIRRIAINTGGGDAPGLNAVIRAVVTAADRLGWETYGIREGYNGLLEPGHFGDGGIVRLTPEVVRDITHLGGTILGTTSVGNPLRYPTHDARRKPRRARPVR